MDPDYQTRIVLSYPNKYTDSYISESQAVFFNILTDSAMRCHWLLLGAVLLLGAIDVTSSLQVRKLARANGNFAFALYNKVIVGADGNNVFFSPFR